jgi:portal protein
MAAPKRDSVTAKKIRERIKKWDDDWRFNKDQYHEFTSFVMGSQWTEDESKLFIDYKKIPLSFNKLAPLINHLLGEQRQNTPNLQIFPGDGVPVETAAVRGALIKEICLNSDSKRVFQTAFQQAAIGGFGAFMIDTDYEGNRSFNQVIMLKDTKDPTWCYWDVSAMSPCKTDGMSAGYRTRMSRKMFAGIYGKETEAAIGSDANYDEGSATGWIFSNDKEITVISDFERIYETEKLYQLSNGRTLTKKELNKLQKIKIDDERLLVDNGEIVSIENEREVPKYSIKHRKVAGEFVLEETDFPSEQLPVIYVDQNSYIDKSGKQICRPIIKDARDAQRYINYLGTQSAYMMRVSRYDQFMVSNANVQSPDTQEIWRDPCTAQGGLVYDESPNGNKPEQLRPPELSASLITQYQRAMSDIESCTGIYGTQMGEQGNETSGAAIDARTKRGNFNTYVPFDSLNRAIACAGTIINEMIPFIYDSQREIMLNLPDSGEKQIMLNKPVDPYGLQIENDMTQGKYKIRLLPGASFEGQKQETLESIQTVLQADPSLFRLVADLYVENLPMMSNNIELRNRLRTIVPPEIIQAGKTGEPIQPKQPEMPPEVMLKLQEMQMKQQQAQMQMQLKMRELEAKEHQLQLEGIRTGQDISVKLQELETEKLLAAANLQEQELRYQAEMQRLEADMQISHADNLVRLLTHKEPKSSLKHKEM